MAKEGEKIQDFWGIVEVMGHNTFAGMVSQFEFAGASFVRVDVPEIPARKDQVWRDGPDGYKRHELDFGPVPAFTKLIGTASIYAMTPCSEELARKTARDLGNTEALITLGDAELTGLRK